MIPGVPYTGDYKWLLFFFVDLGSWELTNALWCTVYVEGLESVLGAKCCGVQDGRRGVRTAHDATGGVSPSPFCDSLTAAALANPGCRG